mmetsp:Transcript_7477/g.22130  ORF Transcript_7477/g.22130 Transcript_7477/m.22130 type:complete len:343 (+) Transcript_7477:586-1614(+)
MAPCAISHARSRWFCCCAHPGSQSTCRWWTMEKLGVCRQMTVLLGLETTMHTIASMTMMRRWRITTSVRQQGVPALCWATAVLARMASLPRGAARLGLPLRLRRGGRRRVVPQLPLRPPHRSGPRRGAASREAQGVAAAAARARLRTHRPTPRQLSALTAPPVQAPTRQPPLTPRLPPLTMPSLHSCLTAPPAAVRLPPSRLLRPCALRAQLSTAQGLGRVLLQGGPSRSAAIGGRAALQGPPPTVPPQPRALQTLLGTKVLTRYSPAAVHWGAAPAAAAAAAVPAVQPAVPSRTRWLPSESHDSVVTCCATMAALCKGVSGAPSFLPDSGRNAKRGFSFGA